MDNLSTATERRATDPPGGGRTCSIGRSQRGDARVPRWSGIIHSSPRPARWASMVKPEKYSRTTWAAPLSLLEAMVAQQRANIVVLLHGGHFGEPAELPITSAVPSGPSTSTAAPKLVMEGMLEISTAYGIKSVALRYFIRAGADPTGPSARIMILRAT